MPISAGRTDRRRELLTAWEQACRARGVPGASEHCTGADALFLVTALSTALRHASETPELGRAARTWGSRFATPVDALSVLSLLRDALVEIAGDGGEGMAVPVGSLNRVFDQMTIEAVDAASANLRSAARNDPLTGTANRRALEEDLGHAIASARRSHLDLAVAVIDLDGLKQINDNEGHAAGDAALVGLVEALRSALREADTLYRTGGDEFVVVAPFTDAAGARALMRRAERAGGPAFSWGVASLAQTGLGTASDEVLAADAPADAAGLLEGADADLYERRRIGRQAASRALRRQRTMRIGSVAASVVLTASVAGLAAALEGGPGGSTGVHALKADARLHGSSNPVGSWPDAPAPGAPSQGPTLATETFGTVPVGADPFGSDLAALLGTAVPTIFVPGLNVPSLPISLPPPAALVGPAAPGITVQVPATTLSAGVPTLLAAGAGHGSSAPATAPAGSGNANSGNSGGSNNGNGGGGNGNNNGGGGGNNGGGNGSRGPTSTAAPAPGGLNEHAVPATDAQSGGGNQGNGAAKDDDTGDGGHSGNHNGGNHSGGNGGGRSGGRG